MAKSKRLRMGGGEYGPVVSGQVNADGTETLRVQAEYVTDAAVIAAAGQLSGEIDTGGRRLAAIVTNTWTAAVMTFQGAAAIGGTYRDLYDDQGNEVTVQAAATRAIGLDAIAYALAPFIALKIRSGTSAAGVNQSVQADLSLIFKG